MDANIVSDAAAVGTFLGVVFAAWQLWRSGQQAKTEFEDRMSEQYRALAAQLPVEVFFDQPVDAKMIHDRRAVFYRYFDLCNEQAFLRKKKRIRSPTWKEWKAGMEANMGREAFDRAWYDEIAPNIGNDFQELKDTICEFGRPEYPKGANEQLATPPSDAVS